MCTKQEEHTLVCFFIDAMTRLQEEFPDGDTSLQDNPVVTMRMLNNGYWSVQELIGGRIFSWLDYHYYVGSFDNRDMFTIYQLTRAWLENNRKEREHGIRRYL